ncbi:ANTAR domain-containing response regulator [Sinanaerobacter chloroacetimidivorans]|jgi:AmiR/NasT family two-component response regulator|uniref:ANTAR domain-containing protein n=1 Tax=Sinanaerobacter chloroacetimidivorans TaxID=2818044 RepID=A0A8J7W3H5_9FIRM|nr:ANTAR domain-containing protein [Sinanaerobacter chloroacetimidivorans]MBR0598411.1 ANTAR domain-containing protein [Sinanaerobacter chloroacetimidivorans]
MEKILLVSRKGKSKDMLLQLLEMGVSSQITTSYSDAEARSLIEKTEFDLVIINSPLEDKSGTDLAVFVTEHSMAGVLMAVQNKYADAVSQKVEPYGVLVVGKPIVRAFFNQAVKFADVTRLRFMTLKEENISLQNKIEELKLISRAKCVLIEYLAMTESQAHKYIEKQSMDLRISKFRVAKRILKAYEQ